MIPSGTYTHFKGGLYEVIGSGTLFATSEPCVLYRPVDSDDDKIYAQSEYRFTERVFVKGVERKRFEKVG